MASEIDTSSGISGNESNHSGDENFADDDDVGQRPNEQYGGGQLRREEYDGEQRHRKEHDVDRERGGGRDVQTSPQSQSSSLRSSFSGSLTAFPSAILAERPAGESRLDAIDITRGLVMVVMALDHCWKATTSLEYEWSEWYHQQPQDCQEMDTELFATRYVSHLAAPGSPPDSTHIVFLKTRCTILRTNLHNKKCKLF